MAQSVRSVVLEDVGSTNTEAFKRAEAGERGPLWIAARRQTQGRGRSGRRWGSEPVEHVRESCLPGHNESPPVWQ